MKIKFAAIAALFIALTGVIPLAHASIQGAPFLPEIDARFNCLESGYCSGGPYVPPGFAAGSLASSVLQQGYGSQGVFAQQLYKADVLINGDVAGNYNTTLVLPAKSIIRQAFIYTKAAITPSGTTTALKCASTGDILAATDETGNAANTIFSGVETGTAANMLYTSAGCTVVLTTAVHTATAGEWTVYLDVAPAP